MERKLRDHVKHDPAQLARWRQVKRRTERQGTFVPPGITDALFPLQPLPKEVAFAGDETDTHAPCFHSDRCWFHMAMLQHGSLWVRCHCAAPRLAAWCRKHPSLHGLRIFPRHYPCCSSQPTGGGSGRCSCCKV